jgi:hypothetical protein
MGGGRLPLMLQRLDIGGLNGFSKFMRNQHKRLSRNL